MKKDTILHKIGQLIVPLKRAMSPLEADWVIIDEASMLSLPMATSILRALPSGCRLTLVGDFNQLPSVDLGHVFADLCVELPNAVSTLKTSNRFEPGGSVDRLAKAMLGEGLRLTEKPEDVVMNLLCEEKISKEKPIKKQKARNR